MARLTARNAFCGDSTMPKWHSGTAPKLRGISLLPVRWFQCVREAWPVAVVLSLVFVSYIHFVFCNAWSPIRAPGSDPCELMGCNNFWLNCAPMELNSLRLYFTFGLGFQRFLACR